MFYCVSVVTIWIYIIYLVKQNNFIGLFVPCDQSVNMIFDPQTVY